MPELRFIKRSDGIPVPALALRASVVQVCRRLTEADEPSLPKMLRKIFIPPTLSTFTPEPAKKWPLYLGLAGAGALALVLYLNTLSLPFFQDDVIHLRWLSYHNVIDPWLTAENLPTYRPLGESLLKVWFMLLGRNVPSILRLQNILMHALNAVLIALLVLRLDSTRRRYVVAGLAAVLFAALPFAYQAVIWINVFFYPLGTLLLLLSALTYFHARTTGKTRWLMLTWLWCLLAPAEIEWGLMSGAILFGLEILWCRQKRSQRPWLVGPIGALTLNAIFFVIWKIVPKFDYSRNMIISAETILQIGTYYLQGLTYPTAPLANLLVGRAGLNDLNAVRLVSALTLISILALLIWRRRTLLALAGLAWFFLLLIPSWITVDFDYVINSPRLLYPAAVGAVILWAAFLAELMAEGRWQKMRAAIVLGLLAVVLAQNFAFVQTENRLYHIAEEPVHALAAAARNAPNNEPLLFVNLPSWLAPVNHDYALGNHGVQFITGYADIKDVIFAYNGIDHPARAIGFTNLTGDVPYYRGLYGAKVEWEGLIEALNQAGEVYLARYEPDRIRLLPAGRVTSVDLGDVTARLGSQLELGSTEVIDGRDTISVTLNWRVTEPVHQDLSVFVHVYGLDGKLVTQSDGYPLLGMAPFGNYQPGQTLQDRHTLEWPQAAPAGTYRVGVGVYDRGSGQRFEARDAQSQRLPDDTVIIVTISR